MSCRRHIVRSGEEQEGREEEIRLPDGQGREEAQDLSVIGDREGQAVVRVRVAPALQVREAPIALGDVVRRGRANAFDVRAPSR